MIRKLIVSVINFFRAQIFRIKEKRRMKEEMIRLEKQAKLEKEIYDEICNIQKIYQEKDRLELESEEFNQEETLETDLILQLQENIFRDIEENIESMTVRIEDSRVDDVERTDEKDDIGIKISEKERDISTTGISITN